MSSKRLIIPSRKYKGESSVFSVRLPADMIKDLDHVAEKTGRNRNEIVTICLEYALDNLVTESGLESKTN